MKFIELERGYRKTLKNSGIIVTRREIYLRRFGKSNLRYLFQTDIKEC